MALETGTYISDLVSTNPVSSDNISQGDDHIRLLKSTIKATFPNITGAVTPTHTDLNKLTASGSPQFSTIELGHASDTTITRSAAGVIAVEGGVVPKENRANTFSADQVFNGNVGIGTAPSYPLQVAKNSTAAYELVAIQNTGAGAYSLIRFINSGSGTADFGITDSGSNAAIIRTGGNERVRIDSSGNVGIGAASTGSKLHVSNSGNTTARIASTDGQSPELSLFSAGVYDRRIVGGATLRFLQDSTEQMRIDSSGNVGVGTTSPSSYAGANDKVLAIQYVDQALTFGAYYQSGVGQVGFINSSNSNNSGSAQPLSFRTGNTERMRITGGGEVYIAGTTDQGAYNLQCNGTGVWGAGAYVNGSDARIKDDIAPIGSCLDIVASLNPVTFRYKEDWSKDQSVQPGFIAQELQASLGNTNYVDGVVMQGPEYMSVAYQSLIPVLTKALQEALTKIDALETRIAALEAA